MAFFSSPPRPQKLNICFISTKSPYPGRGGDETYLFPLARGLANKGHEVTILSWQDSRGRSEVARDGVRAYFLGSSTGANRRNFPRLAYYKFRELHSQRPFHIVHSLDDSAFMIGKERKDLGVVMTYDVSATQMAQLFSIMGMSQETLGGLLSAGFALLYKYTTTFWGKDRQLLGTADGVFVATPLQRIFLERYYLYPEFRTFIVPYNMDHIETELQGKPEELREKLHFPKGSQVVVTFSDLTEFSEVANLLRAFSTVAVKKPYARMVIVGNGPLKHDLEFESLNLVLGNRVSFIGATAVEKQSEYIALADIYVNLSSRTTGFEMPMLEGMAQRKVVIGSELSPIATIIEDEKDGFLVRPADIEGITNIILRVFNSEVSVTEIGEHARTKVLDLFDVNKMVDRMLEAFYSTLERSGRRVKSPPPPEKPKEISTFS